MDGFEPNAQAGLTTCAIRTTPPLCANRVCELGANWGGVQMAFASMPPPPLLWVPALCMPPSHLVPPPLPPCAPLTCVTTPPLFHMFPVCHVEACRNWGCGKGAGVHKHEGGTCHLITPFAWNGSMNKWWGHEAQHWVGMQLEQGGPHTNGRGALPPALVCMHIGHTNWGPMWEWESVPPSPLVHNGNMNGACANPEVAPPLLCTPHPLQRGHANQGLCANPPTPGFGAGLTCKQEVAQEWEGVPPSLFAPLCYITTECLPDLGGLPNNQLLLALERRPNC